jgi:hypothetical protein
MMRSGVFDQGGPMWSATGLSALSLILHFNISSFSMLWFFLRCEKIIT